MKSYNYGTREYYEQKLEIAKTRLALLREAASARLACGTVKAEDFGILAEILEEAEAVVSNYEAELAKIEEVADGGND